jgi:hypothetical protein
MLTVVRNLRGRSGQAVQPDHDQGLPGLNLAQQSRQHGSAAVGAGSTLLEHDVAPGAQLVSLGSVPWFSVDTRAYPISGRGRGTLAGFLGGMGVRGLLSHPFYNWMRCRQTAACSCVGHGGRG